MIRAFFVAIGFILVAVPSANAAVGDWETHTRLDIRRLAATPAAIWAATAGGVIYSSLADGSVRTYSPTEGLSDASILSVAVDDNGTIWFGSQDGGLIRFVPGGPGRQPVLRQPALLRNEVSSIQALIAHGDTLYIGHSTGLTVMEISTELVIETYHQLGPDFAIRNDQITTVGIAGSRIIAGFEHGYSVAERGDNLLLPSSWAYTGSPAFQGTSAIIEFQGDLYIATSSGLQRESQQGWSQVLDAPSAVHDLVAFNGYLFAATDNGLLRSSNGEEWLPSAGLTVPVYALAAVDGQYLVGAAEDGTYRIDSTDATSAVRVAGVDFPPFVFFRQMAIDTSGALWVAPGPLGGGGGDLRDLGFMRYKNNVWTQFVPGRDGIPRPPAEAGYRSIAVDADNRVWVGSHGIGAIVLDQSTEPPTVHRVNASTTSMTGLSGSPSYIVCHAFDIDPTGNVYIAVDNSLAWSVERGFVPSVDDVTHISGRFIGTEVGLTNTPNATVLDREGVLWVGTLNGLLLFDTIGLPTDSVDYQFVGAIGVEGVTGTVGLRNANVRALAMDRTGTIWVGTAGGLTSLRGSYDRADNLYSLTSRHYTRGDGLPSPIINAIAVDSMNVKWIGSDEGLAQVTSSGQLVSLASTPLVDPTGKVVSLAYDHARGSIWIGTETGANRYEAYMVQSGDGITAEPLENPYRISLSRRGADYVLDGEPLRFFVTPGSILRIYTLTGELVWEAEDTGNGQVEWDGRTRSRQRVVASGIYLYIAERAGETRAGKIAVIRSAR